MDKSIFEYSEYKAYLRVLAGVKQRRGIRIGLAKAAHCQPTYVTLVLNGDSHFSLEQAEMISEFLGHSKEELQYFLILIQKARAGTKRLTNFFEEQREKFLQQRLVLTNRLGKEHELTEIQQAKYYSSWIYGAIHIALSIPELQNRRQLSKFLQISLAKVAEVIEFLLECGLITEKDGAYKFSTKQVRLGNHSANIIKHHSNWRNRAIESLEREELHDLHYSGVYSLSREDMVKIKNHLLEQIKECQNIMGKSSEQELICLNVDFFSLRIGVSE